MVAIEDKALEVLICDLMKVSIKAGYEKEKELLIEQKKLLEERRNSLLEEVATKLGELIFYSSKIEEMEDRIESIKNGEAHQLDIKNEDTREHRKIFTKSFLENMMKNKKGDIDG